MKKNIRKILIITYLICNVFLMISSITPNASIRQKALAYDPMRDAAAKLMGEMFKVFDKTLFKEDVSYGDPKIYNNAINEVIIKYNPKIDKVAVYEPEINTITFSFNPMDVLGKSTHPELVSYGETVYHEVTHKIEDMNKDTGYFQSEKYRERNIDYMFNVYQVAIPKLQQLEDLAKAGADDDKLQEVWLGFLNSLDNAKKLPSTIAYPPNVDTLESWFGFHVDPERIKSFYIALGEPIRLKEFFSERSWQGKWQSFALGKVELSQAGKYVTGVFEDSSGNKGKINAIADGPILRGDISRTYDVVFPDLTESQLKEKIPDYFGTIEFNMSKDGKKYSGEIKNHLGGHLYSDFAERKK